MSEDLIKIKPKIGPVEFDLNALWRRLTRKKKSDPVTIVAQRFLRVFDDHGVAVAQIQQFLPQISLDKLRTSEDLLAALNNDVLDETAQLFKIRREWLDGVGDQIYECHACYKAPKRLFEDIATFANQKEYFPVRALFNGRKLDRDDRFPHPLVLVLAEKIRDLGDTEIYRYWIYGDGWSWDHDHSRIQLKAMARLINEMYGSPVPLYRAKDNVLEKIREGECVPRQYLRGSPITNPSLEDYAFSKQESAQSKESDELPYVLDYIKHHGLESIAQSD